MALNLDRITIVLHRLHYPENIGSAARAAMNMGIKSLRLVAPENWDLARALKLATHVAAPLILDRAPFQTLEEALEPFHFVVGTTARTGRGRPATVDPRTMAAKLAQLPDDAEIALLFGPEDRGLSNEELKYCQEVAIIPTAGFHSLNVAQAVLVLAYECLLTSRTPAVAPVEREPHPSPPAEHGEMERMYEHLQDTLTRIDFINPENPRYWMRKLRRTLSRFHLTHRDVALILGLCRQINWFAGSVEASKRELGLDDKTINIK